jgi:hypothetical protein
MSNITEQQLFDRIVTLRTEIETLTLDLKQLKADATYHKDSNPGGIDKADVKVIDKAAQLEVKAKFEDFSEVSSAVVKKYQELSGKAD